MELNVLLLARDLLLARATPCLPYTFCHFVDREKSKRSVKLVLCTEYLSKVTLRRWLKHHVIDCWLFSSRRKINDQRFDLAAHKHLQRQFELLFFHLFAALYTLQRHGNYLHNDLHLDNIVMIQSGETASNFCYQLDGNRYVVSNALGGSLQQLPVICDFGMARRACASNLGLDSYYDKNDHCAYHASRKGHHQAHQCVCQSLCDVLHVLCITKNHLTSLGREQCAKGNASAQQAARNMSVVMSAFTQFDLLRQQLIKLKRTNCTDTGPKNLATIIGQVFSNYLHDEREEADTNLPIVFNCDVALSGTQARQSK